jgi:hypothetical protein
VCVCVCVCVSFENEVYSWRRGAPALSYSARCNFKAIFRLDGDFQQVVRKYGLNEQGYILYFSVRVTRLVQSLSPGCYATENAKKMPFSDVDFDHITEQPSRTDTEAVQAMTGSENKKKAGLFGVWATCNPTDKAELDQMAIDFRIAMKEDIASFKTWAGVKEKFKERHRTRITYEFALPRDQWEFPPTNYHD